MSDELNQNQDQGYAMDAQQRQMMAHLAGQAGEGAAAGAMPGADFVEPMDPQQAEMTGLLVAVLTPTFAVLAPNWQIRPPEVRQLASAYAPVVLKYFPDGLGEVGPELAAALVTLTILGSRLGTPRRVVIVREEAADGGDKPTA